MSDIDHESSRGPERLNSWTMGLVKYAIGVTCYLYTDMILGMICG